MKNRALLHISSAVKNWWISLVVGVLAIALGIWCMFTPLATFVALTYVFIIMFLLSGLVDVILALSNRDIIADWGWTLAGGIFEIILGIVLIALPQVAVGVILIYLIGFWILFRSFWMIGEAFDLHYFGARGWGWLLALGALGVIFSFIFLLSPAFSTVFVVTFFCVALIIYGIFRIYMAAELQSLHKIVKEIEDV